MLTLLERTPVEPAARDEVAHARLRAWLDTQVKPQAQAQAEPAAAPLSLDAQTLHWLPLLVPLTAMMIVATMALIWAAAL